MDALIDILMALSYITFWGSRFLRTKKGMLIGHSVGIGLFRIPSFALDGNINGIENSILIVVRNITIQCIDKKKRKIKVLFFVLYVVVSWTLYFIAYAGVQTWFVACSGTATTLCFVFGKEQIMRIGGIVGASLYACFQFFSGQYVGFVLEMVTCVANLCSFVFYRIKNKGGKRVAEKV